MKKFDMAIDLFSKKQILGSSNGYSASWLDEIDTWHDAGPFLNAGIAGLMPEVCWIRFAENIVLYNWINPKKIYQTSKSAADIQAKLSIRFTKDRFGC